jgi:hypothetical protein
MVAYCVPPEKDNMSENWHDACPLCGKTAAEGFSTGVEYDFGGNVGSNYAVCPCGLRYSTFDGKLELPVEVEKLLKAFRR